MTKKGTAEKILPSVHPYDLPPDGFDPLNASDRILAQYGLPERWYAEAEPRYLEFWREMLGPSSPGLARKYLSYPDPRIGKGLDALQQPVARARFDHRENSRNWSGAYITPIPRPNRFMVVAGAWTVPSAAPPSVVPSNVDPSDVEYRSSTWIGIGGNRSYNSMPQIGTSQSVTVSGSTSTAVHTAWWQWWVADSKPHHRPIEIPGFDVTAHDPILAMIIIESPTPGDAHFIIANQRTGVLTAFKVRAPASIEPLGASAEWVHERPSDPKSHMRYPLPKCSDVVFRHCFALNAPDFGMSMTFQDLQQNGRLIRMVEHFPDPHRSALVSIPDRLGSTSLRIRYQEAGT